MSISKRFFLERKPELKENEKPKYTLGEIYRQIKKRRENERLKKVKQELYEMYLNNLKKEDEQIQS